MAATNETWSERFVREVDTLVHVARRRPVLAIVFIAAITFYGWHQFLKEKTETISKPQVNKGDPTLTPERFVNTIAGSPVEIYVRESKDSISLRFRAPADWVQSAIVDVNQNHTLDPHVDVSYSNIETFPCFQYLLSEQSSTTCGAFRSSATLEVLDEPGSWKSTTWFIPKVELNSGGSSVWLIVDTYNTRTKQYYFKGSFDKPIQIPFSSKKD